MLEEKSRYAKRKTYPVTDSRGRLVPVVPVPDPPKARLLGIHLRKQAQRLDHLAFKYLHDGTAFWRICEANDAMLPESLSEQQEINIPNKNG